MSLLMSRPEINGARTTYEEMAVVYDAFTAAYDYERWLTAVERLAVDAGLRGRDVLDVACGTGKSFMPLLERGYRVTACDLSPEMVAIAEDKSAGRAEIAVADMRALPALGEFDLITCLDDSLNYLLTDADVESALAGMTGLLRPGGVLVFDCNSLQTYRTVFTQTFAFEQAGVFFCWQGETEPDLAPRGHAAATLEAFAEASPHWSRRSARHRQRHHPPAWLAGACGGAGLELVTVLGQNPGVRLDATPDDLKHTKLLYVARRGSARR